MNFKIEDNTIFITLSGSQAYGMATPTSDIDIKGVAIPPSEYFLGFSKKFEQFQGIFPRNHLINGKTFTQILEELVGRIVPEEEEIDSTIYDIKKFMFLASQCNPSIIEVLFTDPKCHILSSKLFDLLIENRDLFLSQKAKYTFSGYSFQQLKRIKLHRAHLLNPPKGKPTRADFGLPETSLIPADQREGAEALIKKKVNQWICIPDELPKDVLASVRINTIDAFLDMWEGLVGNCYRKIEKNGEVIMEPLAPPIDGFNDFDPEKLVPAAETSLGFSSNFLEVLDKERAYRSALRSYNQYQEWKQNRNAARAEMEAKFGFDGKHGSHLVRLLRMAEEILVEGKVIVCRPDAEELLSIRKGAWSYDRLIEWATEKQDKINEFYSSGKSPLPKNPKLEKIDNLCQKIVEMSLK